MRGLGVLGQLLTPGDLAFTLFQRERAEIPELSSALHQVIPAQG